MRTRTHLELARLYRELARVHATAAREEADEEPPAGDGVDEVTMAKVDRVLADRGFEFGEGDGCRDGS